MKKIYIGLILFFLTATLCACAKSDKAADTNPASQATTRTGNILDTPEINYREVDIPIPADFSPHEVRFMGREVFLFDGQNVLVMDQEGNELRRVIFSDDEFFIKVDLQSDRSFWAVTADYKEGDSYLSGKIPENISFVLFDRNGAELERVKADGSQFGKNEVQFHLYRLLTDGDYFYLMSLQAVYIVDKSGQMVMEVKAEGESLRAGEGIFKSLFRLKDGRVAMASFANSERANISANFIQIPELKEKTVEEIMLSTATTDNIYVTGKEGDILFCTANGFYDYDLTTGNQSLLFNNLQYGVTLSNMAEIVILTDGSITIAERSGAMIDRLTRFVPYVPSEETAEDVDYSKAEKRFIWISKCLGR